MSNTWICSCGYYEWHENTGDDLEDFGPSAWYHNWPCDGGDYNNNIFCFKCGDKLLPDGTVESRAEVDKVLGHFHCAGCLHEKQSDHYEPCTYCKRKYEDEYTPIKQEATE